MRLIASMIALLIAGCVTPPKPRDPTVVVFQTTKNKEAAVSDITKALSMKGFSIKSTDQNAGIVSTEPSAFNWQGGLGKLTFPGRSSAQIMIDGASVRVTITHECGIMNVIMGGGVTYQHCNGNDAVDVTREKEKEFLEAVRSAL